MQKFRQFRKANGFTHSDDSLDAMTYFSEEAVIIEKNEKVINKTEVQALISKIENVYLGINEIVEWPELKKKLGIS